MCHMCVYMQDCQDVTMASAFKRFHADQSGSLHAAACSLGLSQLDFLSDSV